MARITKTHLKNGIPIITEEMPDVESATVGLWVKTGARDESEEIRGVSHFIEHLLFKGTKKRTAFDIAKSIEAVGGVLNAFTSREYTCFYAKVLNKDLP
ncbi:MAG: insulinase family protein, partial [Deltaproteobacteria bacterium]|nr:insulinase family protein [Deltaproteobacteria bacterium]